MIEVVFNNKEGVNLTEEELLKEKLVAILRVVTSYMIEIIEGKIK